MRINSIVILLLLLPFVSYAQKDTADIYNAYTLCKKISELKNKTESGESFSRQDSSTVKYILSYLVWYADLQDADKKNQLPELLGKLKDYPVLNEVFSSLYLPVNENMSLDTGKINMLISKIEKAKQPDSLSILFNNYKNDLKQSGQKYRALDSIQSVIKTRNVIVDSIQKKKDSVLTVQKYSKEDTISTSPVISQLESALTTWQEQLISIENTLQKEIKKETNNPDVSKRRLLDYLSKQKNNSEISNIIASINNLTVPWQNFFTFNNADTKEAISNSLSVKENAIESAEAATLKFQLPSEAQIIDAIAIYLAKRVKQEAIMWFFEKIKRNANRYELIQAFFRNTITLLQSNEVYEIPNLGSQWRYALSKDFIKMPRNVINSDWFKKWLATKTGNDSLVVEYLQTGFDISELLLQQYNYRNLVKQLYLKLQSSNNYSDSKSIQPKDIFSLLYAVNEECFIINQKDSGSLRLLQFEELRKMNKEELEIMLSLINMKYGQPISKLMKATGSFEISTVNINSVRQWLGGITSGIRQFEKLQQNFYQTQEEIKNGKKQEAVYSLFNLWGTVNDLFDLVIPDSAMKPAWMKGVNSYSERIKSFTRNGFEVYNQISLKNYAGAANSVIQILEAFFYNSPDSLFHTTKTRLDPVLTNLPSSYTDLNNTKVRTLPDAIDLVRNESKAADEEIKFSRKSLQAAIVFERDRHAIQLIRKLAGFLNDVVLAKDSKQLSKVVESYAMPPGSYKRKRNNWWSLDLNAFVGAYAGYEVARRNVGTPELPYKSEGWVYGITAPIGLSISKTFGRKLEPKHPLTEDLIRNPDKVRLGRKNVYQRGTNTLTLTLNVIDLGAVVSYRFNNTKDSILPQKIKWEQFISPGMHLAYGIRNTPLVFSVGMQYTPRLRKLSAIENDPGNQQYNAFRFQAGILFDIPLFNLWERSYYAPVLKKD